MKQEIRSYCRSKGFHPQTEARWLGYNDVDREALLELMSQVKAGENHLKDLLDCFEEIALRDGTGIAALLREDLSGIVSDPRLGRNDKLRRLKDELRRRRFPRLALIEAEIQRRIRELKLAAGVSLSVPQGLEGGSLTLKIEATSHEEMRRLTGEVARLVESDGLREIFSWMRGEQATAGERES